MINETDIQQILKTDGFELSDDDFQLLLEIVKSQINQGLVLLKLKMVSMMINY